MRVKSASWAFKLRVTSWASKGELRLKYASCPVQFNCCAQVPLFQKWECYCVMRYVFLGIHRHFLDPNASRGWCNRHIESFKMYVVHTQCCLKHTPIKSCSFTAREEKICQNDTKSHVFLHFLRDGRLGPLVLYQNPKIFSGHTDWDLLKIIII